MESVNQHPEGAKYKKYEHIYFAGTEAASTFVKLHKAFALATAKT